LETVMTETPITFAMSCWVTLTISAPPSLFDYLHGVLYRYREQGPERLYR